jgi:glucosamine kinase
LDQQQLLLGIDGGGTKCRARLCTLAGDKLGEGIAGPANIRLGLETSLAAVLQATRQALAQAGLSSNDLPRVFGCLALAGASEPTVLAAAQTRSYPFACTIITSDAHAACVGAHRGRDGGIIIAGTGSIGWAELGGRHYRIGGWGLPVSDEGSGAWLGCEALRRVLWAHDARIAWTPVLETIFAQFENDPHAIVRWTLHATPRDFGSLAPLVAEHAEREDAAAIELMQLAAGHIDVLASRLIELGADRLAMAGGLALHMKHWIADSTLTHLIPPAGDALDGALELARAAALSLAPERQAAG